MGLIAKVFNKDEYADPPGEQIKLMLDKLWVLGKAVLVGRGDSYSANILGTIHLGDDNGPVFRGKKAFLGECECHFHMKWGEVANYTFAEEDVGYGPEAVIYLLGADGRTIVRIFYPHKRLAEVEAVLAAPAVPRPEPPPSPFRFVFTISFPSEDKLNLYVTFWNDISRVIQREPGALGTRLHRIRGSQPAVLAIAEWESTEARAAAYARLDATLQTNAVVIAAFIRDLGGKVTIIAEADEIAAVFP